MFFWGGALNCQSRMDEEAALHSKGLWGNTTDMTHTNTCTAHKYSVCAPALKCINVNVVHGMRTHNVHTCAHTHKYTFKAICGKDYKYKVQIWDLIILDVSLNHKHQQQKDQ